MFYYLIKSGASILWFCVYPFVGYMIKKFFSKSKIIVLLVLSSILFCPILVGYSYVQPLLDESLFLIIISCTYSLMIDDTKWQLTSITSLSSFLFLGFVIFFGKMLVTLKKKNQWNIGNYKIEYFEERGFSGGPLLAYKLNKYTEFPVFIKEIESKEDTDTINNCIIKFPTSKFQFNKCTGGRSSKLQLTIEIPTAPTPTH